MSRAQLDETFASLEKRQHKGHSQTNYFYQGNKRAIQVTGKNNFRAFWARTVVVAQRLYAHDQTHSALLKADMAGSVIGAKPAACTHAPSYSPYGFYPAATIADSRPAFNGQFMEARLGAYLLGNGYRLYNPALMRFQSSDSESPFGSGGFNTYAYCKGDPVNHSDPTGHFPGAEVSNNTSWFLNLLQPAAEMPPSPRSIASKLRTHSTHRLSGYYYEPQSQAAAKFYTFSDRTGALKTTSELMSIRHPADLQNIDHQIPPGVYMLKHNIAISAYIPGRNQPRFLNLLHNASSIVELKQKGFELTTINRSGPKGHIQTKDGIFRKFPTTWIDGSMKFEGSWLYKNWAPRQMKEIRSPVLD